MCKQFFNRFLVLFVGLLTMCVTQVWGAGTDQTVTYTWTYSSSKFNVSSSGTTPDGSSASLTSTYTNANQLTGSKTQTFTLSGYDGCTITGLSINMKRSNSASAKANITVSANGTQIGSSSNLTLTTSQADYSITVTPTKVNSGKTIVVTVSAAANSIYVYNYKVTYTPKSSEKYSVTLSDDSGNPLAESSPGAGVTLPSRSGNATWTFAGWSETNNAIETTTAPTIIPAGSYKPSANVTLYPVYTRTQGGSGFLLSQTVSGTTYYAQAQGSNTYLPATTTKASATAFYLEDNSTQKNLYWMDGATKYYVGGAGSSTALDAKATSASHSWNVTEGTGTLTFKSGSRWLTLNTSTKDRFSTYTTEYALTITPNGTTYYISVIGPATYTASVAGGLVNGSIKWNHFLANFFL